MIVIIIKYLWIGTWQNVSMAFIVYSDLSVLLVEMYSFSVFNITFSWLRKKKRMRWWKKIIKVQGDKEVLGIFRMTSIGSNFSCVVHKVLFLRWHLSRNLNEKQKSASWRSLRRERPLVWRMDQLWSSGTRISERG